MRQFLAIELPVTVREELARLQDLLLERGSGWRRVRPESMHLTVRFLGEVSPGTDLRCRGAWRAATAPHGPFRLIVAGTGVFPSRGRPAVVWAGVCDRPPGALSRLAEDVEIAAREMGFAPRRRGFSAHLTLARARRGPRQRRPQLDGWRCAHPVEARGLTLFESRLRPEGPRYRALEVFQLGGTR